MVLFPTPPLADDTATTASTPAILRRCGGRGQFAGVPDLGRPSGFSCRKAPSARKHKVEVDFMVSASHLTDRRIYICHDEEEQDEDEEDHDEMSLQLAIILPVRHGLVDSAALHRLKVHDPLRLTQIFRVHHHHHHLIIVVIIIVLVGVVVVNNRSESATQLTMAKGQSRPLAQKLQVRQNARGAGESRLWPFIPPDAARVLHQTTTLKPSTASTTTTKRAIAAPATATTTNSTGQSTTLPSGRASSESARH